MQICDLSGEKGALLNHRHGTVMSFDHKRGAFHVLLQLEKDLETPGGQLTEAITVQSLFHPVNLQASGAVATVRELQVQIASPKFCKVDDLLTDVSLRELIEEHSVEHKKVRV